MKTRVSFYYFRNWFESSSTYKNAYTYDGMRAIFDYIEDYERDSGEEVDFDPVAICCEWNEALSYEDIVTECGYSGELDTEADESGEYTKETKEKIREYMEENTQVVWINGYSGHCVYVAF